MEGKTDPKPREMAVTPMKRHQINPTLSQTEDRARFDFHTHKFLSVKVASIITKLCDTFKRRRDYYNILDRIE
jgi:hypothetical protein